jgi:hypothetical protein
MIIFIKQFIHLFVLTFFIFQTGAQAQYDASGAAPVAGTSASSLTPETKAFLIICGYGAVGGGLLGLASMAFGGEARNIAKGASIGLYAGILFGAYVIYYSSDVYHDQDPSMSDESMPSYGRLDLQDISTSDYLLSQAGESSPLDFFVPVLNYRF